MSIYLCISILLFVAANILIYLYALPFFKQFRDSFVHLERYTIDRNISLYLKLVLFSFGINRKDTSENNLSVVDVVNYYLDDPLKSMGLKYITYIIVFTYATFLLSVLGILLIN